MPYNFRIFYLTLQTLSASAVGMISLASPLWQLYRVYIWHRGLVKCKPLNCHICCMLSVSEVELKFKLPEKWCHIWTETHALPQHICYVCTCAAAYQSRLYSFVCIRTCWCNGLVNMHYMKMSWHFPPFIRFLSEVQKANRLRRKKAIFFPFTCFFFGTFLDSLYMKVLQLRNGYAKIFMHMLRVEKMHKWIHIYVCMCVWKHIWYIYLFKLSLSHVHLHFWVWQLLFST